MDKRTHFPTSFSYCSDENQLTNAGCNYGRSGDYYRSPASHSEQWDAEEIATKTEQQFSFEQREQLSSHREEKDKGQSNQSNQNLIAKTPVSTLETSPMRLTNVAFNPGYQHYQENVVSEPPEQVKMLPQTPHFLHSNLDERATYNPAMSQTIICSDESDINPSIIPSIPDDNEEDATNFNFLKCFLDRLGSPKRNSSLFPQVSPTEDCYRTDEKLHNLSELLTISGGGSSYSSQPPYQTELESERNHRFSPLYGEKDLTCIHASFPVEDSPEQRRNLLNLNGKQEHISMCGSRGLEHKDNPEASTASTSHKEVYKESMRWFSPTKFQKTSLPVSYKRSQNWFATAHRDIFGVSPPEQDQLQDVSTKFRKTYPSDYDDECDSLESDYLSSYSSIDSFKEQNVVDSSSWTLEETLNSISKPTLGTFPEPRIEDLHNFLNPHEVGHINYLVKCYSDAVFSINIPSNLIESGRSVSPVTYLNLHMLGVFQVYYLLFKCEDFRNLTLHDQVCLLETNMTSILVSLGLIFFDVDSKSWKIPFVMSNTSSMLPMSSLLQVIPEDIVHNLTVLHTAAKDLNIDETTSLLLAFIIVYTPVNRPVKELDIIDKVRDKYVNILLQYLRWRFGASNGALLFTEILKILDSLLKISEEINDYKLRLSDDEISTLKCHFRYIEEQIPATSQYNLQVSKDDIDAISYSIFHAKLSSIFLRLGASQN